MIHLLLLLCQYPQHEVASVMMFDYLISSNDLMSEFEKYGLTSRDLEFIKEQIAGPRQLDTDWNYKGRSEEKSFLYEVSGSYIPKPSTTYTTDITHIHHVYNL